MWIVVRSIKEITAGGAHAEANVRLVFMALSTVAAITVSLFVRKQAAGFRTLYAPRDNRPPRLSAALLLMRN